MIVITLPAPSPPAPQAHISLMPNMELGSLAQGLQKLERDYRGVADADMDAMFQQVWGEGRGT